MPLQIIHKDITQVECDAVVNPTDSFFSGSAEQTARYTRQPGLSLKLSAAGFAAARAA